MTDTAARTAVLRDALLAAATGDQALIDRVYTEDVTGWSPVLEVTSRDDLAADLRGRKAAFSAIDLTLDPVDAVGDKLIAEWRVAATHSGVLALDEELQLEPTGRRLELRGVCIAEFEGDRIRRFRQYWNEVELIDGLGLLPEA
jgi:ketosteroid isomerase-like protein